MWVVENCHFLYLRPVAYITACTTVQAVIHRQTKTELIICPMLSMLWYSNETDKNSLHRLALAKAYLPTKFQVRSFIRSKDIERYEKIINWVTKMTFKRHSRSSRMTRLWSAYFLLAFHSNYLASFPRYNEILLENRKFLVSHLYLAPL